MVKLTQNQQKEIVDLMKMEMDQMEQMGCQEDQANQVEAFMAN